MHIVVVFLDLGSHARKQLVGKQRGKEQLFLWSPDRRNKNVGEPEKATEQKISNIFLPICSAFSTLGKSGKEGDPAPLFPHPPPACLVIQEEEGKESNIMLKIGLEGQ